VLLPDFEIRRLCQKKQMVTPYVEAHLNPASLDVTLGDRIMIEVTGTRELEITGIHNYSEEQPYWIKPGEFFLAETREIFHLPDYVAGVFCLKSSRARDGWDHAEAGFCDPSWFGSRLTMELKNSRRLNALPIWPGMRIGQMLFMLISGTPERGYDKTGKYNCDLGVTASKD
jgi:dCTP deaminase